MGEGVAPAVPPQQGAGGHDHQPVELAQRDGPGAADVLDGEGGDLGQGVSRGVHLNTDRVGRRIAEVLLQGAAHSLQGFGREGGEQLILAGRREDNKVAPR